MWEIHVKKLLKLTLCVNRAHYWSAFCFSCDSNLNRSNYLKSVRPNAAFFDWQFDLLFQYILSKSVSIANWAVQFAEIPLLCSFCMCIRPAQIFLGFPPQNPRWSLGQILPGHQFSANSEVVWPRHGGSEGPWVGLNKPYAGTFGASLSWSNNFRIGWKLVSRQDLAQTSPWSLRRFSKKKVGQA